MPAHLLQMLNDGFKEILFSGITIFGTTPCFLCCQKVSYVNLEQIFTLNPEILLTMVKSDAQLLMQSILKNPKTGFRPPKTAPPRTQIYLLPNLFCSLAAHFIIFESYFSMKTK
jgi:hypothetical protein